MKLVQIAPPHGKTLMILEPEVVSPELAELMRVEREVLTLLREGTKSERQAD